MSVCVRPGWKPRIPVFSCLGSLILNFEMMFNRIFNGKKDKCIIYIGVNYVKCMLRSLMIFTSD